MKYLAYLGISAFSITAATLVLVALQDAGVGYPLAVAVGYTLGIVLILLNAAATLWRD